MRRTDLKIMNNKCNNCMVRDCENNKECIYRAKKLNYDLSLDKKLENYVYFNLNDFGNCYISNNDYKKIGEKNIIKDIINNGFESAKIEKLENNEGYILYANKK